MTSTDVQEVRIKRFLLSLSLVVGVLILIGIAELVMKPEPWNPTSIISLDWQFKPASDPAQTAITLLIKDPITESHELGVYSGTCTDLLNSKFDRRAVDPWQLSAAAIAAVRCWDGPIGIELAIIRDRQTLRVVKKELKNPSDCGASCKKRDYIGTEKTVEKFTLPKKV